VPVPDFTGADAKVSRAHACLDALDHDITDFFASYNHPIGGHYEPEAAQITLYAVGHEDVPVVEWGLRIGECLHNLRSALDHLAWQFALSHLGREPTEQEATRIQFPLEDTPDRFKKAGVRKYVSPKHLAYMDVFQPYHSGDDAATHKLSILRRLSNLDKHRVVPAATITPEAVDLSFDEASDIASYEAIELFIGEPMEQDQPIGRIIGVVPGGPNPQMNASGPFQFGVVLDIPDDPVVHKQPVLRLLGQLGEMADGVVSTAEANFRPD
jgi:hypothetical protein